MHEGEIIVSIRPFGGPAINISEPFSDLTEVALGSIKSTDEPFLSFAGDEHLISSETYERAVKFREDAVERLSSHIARMLLDYAKQQDRFNGYPINR